MPLKSFNKIWIIIIVILIGSLGFYILAGKQIFTRQEIPNNASQSLVSPLFDTFAWRTQVPGGLFIRDSIDVKNLLLTIRSDIEMNYNPGGNKHGAVYLYDSGAQSLQQVPDEQWDNATTPIIDVKGFFESHKVEAKFKVSGEKLFFGNKEIPYRGKLIMDTAYSPDGNQFAVLSADGPLRSVTPNFLGGGGKYAKGQHYHQVFSTVNGTPIGNTVKLPFTTQNQPYSVYWPPDGKYILYIALAGSDITIVKTSLQNK
ncbi:MAG: hypothetical protein UW24_C0010G0004 [Parcubacteria group bacterium GW2011_GWA2_44_12]|nr:MAG: hypothetical protein UW24_C0010G0004 [Parcubacteria group bacterium GW2011_GWA2_44_12]